MVSTAAGSPIKVALDVTSLLGLRTGIAEAVHHLGWRLAARSEVDLTGLSISWRGGNPEAVMPPGTTVKSVKLPARLSHGCWRRFDRPRLSGFDVVHGPNYVVPPVNDAERLVTVHDLTAWRHPELVDFHSRYYPEQLSRALAAGAHVHAVSHYVAAEIVDYLQVDPDRVHTVANGFTPGPSGDRAVGRSLIGAPYVLAIGTIEPRKDYPTLVEAMASVLEVHPDLRLAIVGADGWGLDAFRQAVRSFGVGDRIVRVGYVTDQQKADLLAGAELLAYPSMYEGFGFPVLEGMSVGVPVVTTTAGALPEVAGRAAVLVAPGDPTALAAALLTLIEDDGLRASLAEAGRRRVAGFSWDRMVDEMVDLYSLLVGRSSPMALPRQQV